MGPDLDGLQEWLAVPAADLPSRSVLPVTILPTREDVHRRFAADMFDEFSAAATRGEELTVIVPIGPKAHYPLLARRVNEAGLSLRHVSLFGMDQWLDWQGRPLPPEHPLNLEAYFDRHFVSLIDTDLRPAAKNVVFPDVLDLDFASRELERRGGAATTYGGFGFQGHIAFNEPPRSRWTQVTLEQLRNGQTRVTPVSVDTIIAHAQRALGGNVFGVPPMAITLGMRDLLAAARIRLYADSGAWKQTILRILLFSEPTVDYPVTLVRDHADVEVVCDEATAACPATDW